LASHEDQRKCFVLACTLVFKRNGNTIFRGCSRSTSFNPLGVVKSVTQTMLLACIADTSAEHLFAGFFFPAFLITHHSGKTSLQRVSQLFGERLNDRSVGRRSRWPSARETSTTSRVPLFRSGISRESDACPWLLLARFIVEIR